MDFMKGRQSQGIVGIHSPTEGPLEIGLLILVGPAAEHHPLVVVDVVWVKTEVLSVCYIIILSLYISMSIKIATHLFLFYTLSQIMEPKPHPKIQ